MTYNQRMRVSDGPVSGLPLVWLRLEGLCALLLAALLYWHLHASWLMFAVLFFTPDVAMLGYLAGPRVGSATYNIVHSYVLSLALVGFAVFSGERRIFPFALIWIAHIGFDRMLGYGLKYSSAFGHTHLGWIGRQNSLTTPAPTPESLPYAP